MTSTAAAPTSSATSDPAEVVRMFLLAFQARNLDEASRLLAGAVFPALNRPWPGDR
jgi:limonene-1,2-epoxide hydrolase